MNCPNCQNPIQDGEKFCGKCGNANIISSSPAVFNPAQWEGNKTIKFFWFIILATVIVAILSFSIFPMLVFIVMPAAPITAILTLINIIYSLVNLKRLNRLNLALLFIGTLPALLFILVFVISPLLMVIGMAIYGFGG